ncbi:MAG: hypothetical protein OQK12_09485 [Motiliproteus sp.]|nr:hypothetical protein [Motiliproteus sp.]MCW9052370.1 hypothetical protein [Motiliproteus sp.]
MKLYIQLEENDEIKTASVTALIRAISEWLPESGCNAEQMAAAEQQEQSEDDGILPQVGLYLQVKRRAELKVPLNFLYTQAKKHKVEFVVGIVDEKTGEQEDVCFFGYEEGKPDAFEISNYLGL